MYKKHEDNHENIPWARQDVNPILPNYLNKLDITSQKVSLELVKEIQEKHLAAFSFNNIAVLLVGKVLNNQNIEPPRTHRITLLTFENEEYLVDVGFGAHCPTEPIKVANISLYKTHRLIKEEKEYKLQLPAKNKFFTLYKFDLENYTHADCVMGNFYSSNYKDAVFVNNLVLSLIQKESILSLKNNTYHRIKKGTREILHIDSTDDLYEVINNEFGIALNIEQCEILRQQKES